MIDTHVAPSRLRRALGPIAMTLTFYLLVADSAGPDSDRPDDAGISDTGASPCAPEGLEVSLRAEGTCGTTSTITARLDETCSGVLLADGELAGLPSVGTMLTPTAPGLEGLYFELAGPVGGIDRRCRTTTVTAEGRVFSCYDGERGDPSCAMTLTALP